MASVSSTSNATQSGLQQLRLQQARRNADQAEQVAQALKAQANDAQRAADGAQQNADSLTTQSGQASAKAGQARQGLTASATVQQAVTQLSDRVDQVIGREAVTATSATTTATSTTGSTGSTNSAPVLNSQGQVTGTIINITA